LKSLLKKAKKEVRKMRLKNEVPKRWNPENLNPVRKTEKKSPQKPVRRPGGQKPRKNQKKNASLFLRTELKEAVFSLRKTGGGCCSAGSGLFRQKRFYQ
jgi:hypothetical protein